MLIYHADVPVKTLEAYGEVIVGHLQAETVSTQLSTFWNAVALCVELCDPFLQHTRAKKRLRML
ncbi:hypothetical protein F4Z98_15670 [Candidatus Poribacteria bacterium]|nr:hypothetical protein [Candidatus Poribacteria bacterium]MYB01731.1 hypothetical protein [Candidatus Poribacteria bacterium]